MTSINHSYVPGYEHDIFVSYAHIDNEPLFGAQEGWVTTLVNNLKNLLGVKLGCVEAGKAEVGKKEVYSLWMDYKLPPNEPVTPEIDNCLKSSATFLPILSTGYLASQWCRSEFETFLKQVGSGSGRIFMVEYHFMERSEKPLEFQELLGYPFWFREPTGRTRTLGIPIPNPNSEPEYYRILDDLAHQLASKLRELRIQVEKNEVINLLEIQDTSANTTENTTELKIQREKREGISSLNQILSANNPHQDSLISADENIKKLGIQTKSKEIINSLTQILSANNTLVIAQEIPDMLTNTAEKTLENSRDEGFIEVNTKVFLGNEGKILQLPCGKCRTVSYLLNRIFFSLHPKVRTFTYNQSWVLRDTETGQIFYNLGN